MRWAWLAVAGLWVLGCGEANPMSSRLRPGVEALVYNDPKAPERNDYVFVDVAKGSGFLGSDHIDVLFETVVQVLEDPGEVGDPERLVLIRVLEGEYKGRTGKIKRWFLRALPAK